MILQGSCEIIRFVFVSFSLTSTISTSTFSFQVIYLLISCRNIYLSHPFHTYGELRNWIPKKSWRWSVAPWKFPTTAARNWHQKHKNCFGFCSRMIDFFCWIEDGISVNFLLVTFWKGSKKLHASKFLWYDWYGHFLPPYLSKDNHAMLTGARELPIRLSIHMFCAYKYAHTERRDVYVNMYKYDTLIYMVIRTYLPMCVWFPLHIQILHGNSFDTVDGRNPAPGNR